MKAMRLILLGFALSLAPVNAGPPFPPQVTQSATTAVFYFWGYSEAHESLALIGPEISIRLSAQIMRTMAFYFVDSPPMFAYLWGRADAFEREADRKGEPDL